MYRIVPTIQSLWPILLYFATREANWESSLYRELGPGQRVALSKLAVEHYERHGRPLRLAIDYSIWSFQNQAASGGKNPELRTLYYRLIRLLSLSIQPLFVFDGPHKPPFKRGSQINPNGTAAAAYFSQHARELLALFGFAIHQAPGEAEAECATLQKHGIVDAVLSEDVDTLMFGCSVHLRNWSSASSKGKTPTHVDLYRAEAILDQRRLDREGMILVAMLSGGDYLPGGLLGCGIKIACEAAKAGFGTELCKIDSNDQKALDEWRDWFQHELSTNEGGHFRRTHKNLIIPATFPNKIILSYYTHPAITSPEEIQHISQNLQWDKEINIHQLRLFVAQMFEWKNLKGTKKFIRTLAPALLVRRLYRRANAAYRDINTRELEEQRLVQGIHGRRKHFNTDATPELRIAFIPADIVKINLEEEEDVAPMVNESSSESEADEQDPKIVYQGPLPSPRKPRPSSRYNPLEVDKLWILETFVKLGVPLLTETWEEEMRTPKTFATRKAKERTELAKPPKPKSKTASGGMKPGALDGFVKLSKPGAYQPQVVGKSPLKKPVKESQADLLMFPRTQRGIQKSAAPFQEVQSDQVSLNEKVAKKSSRKPTAKSSKLNPASIAITPSKSDNPWTLARRPPDSFGVQLPPGKRYSALGIYGSQDMTDSQVSPDGIPSSKADEPPASLPDSSSTLRKHTMPTSSSSVCKSSRCRTEFENRCDDESEIPGTENIDLDMSTADESELMEPRPNLNQISHTSRVSTPRRLCTPNAKAGRQQDVSNKQDTNLDVRIINRELAANGRSPTPVSPASNPGSLPSPSVLFSGKTIQTARPSSVSPSPTKEPRKAKTLIMVRESLEGAWRHAEAWEVAEKPTKILPIVDVVDLT